jgi:ribosomal protein S18 acetylase RimI-like enzyme
MQAFPMEIRRLRADEWQVFKSLRLAALQQDGDQFGQSYDVVKNYTDERWQQDAERAATSDEFYVVLAFEWGTPVGMAGCIRTEDFGKIVAVWVDPAHRGQGLGRRLVQATMEIAACERYKLTVVADNHAAIQSYQRLGFVPTGFQYVNQKGFREMEMIWEANTRKH